MPRRLILFIFIFAVILLFVAFNLTNKCDISFGFTKIKDAPVFLTVFASFFLGMLCALPFVFSAGARRNNKERPVPGPSGRTGRFGRPGLLNKADTVKPDRDSGKPSGDSEYSDRSTYGID